MESSSGYMSPTLVIIQEHSGKTTYRKCQTTHTSLAESTTSHAQILGLDTEDNQTPSKFRKQHKSARDPLLMKQLSDLRESRMEEDVSENRAKDIPRGVSDELKA